MSDSLKKRGLALLLALVMATSVLPVSAFAAEGDGSAGSGAAVSDTADTSQTDDSSDVEEPSDAE